MNITLHRLHNQRIASTNFDNPADVVSWLGAVQAQDYLGALWAVGLRSNGATEAGVEQALADRTWKRNLTKNSVVIDSNCVRTLSEAEEHPLKEAERRYGKFLGLPVVGP